LSALSEAGARLYLAHAERHPLVFVHAVTGPAALRALLPQLPGESRATAFAYAWQAVAAWAAAFGGPAPATAPHETPPPGAPDDVEARSLETGDEHAIKLLDACRREAAANPTPVYLRAAGDWAGRLLRAATWSRGRRAAAGLLAG